MDAIHRILTLSPFPELMARRLYYSFLRGKMPQHKASRIRVSGETTKKDSDKLFRHLKEMGISEGDLLIVHSSADALKTIDCNEDAFIDHLIELVGVTGTIAFPAFPEESMLKEEKGLKIYDPKRSVAWTGMLPNLLLRRKGAIRSSFPCNPLVAFGAEAEEMMAKNLETVFPHGKGSCWGFCAEQHAKVLFIGIPTFHSNTILHVVEDYQPDFWPEDWYTEQEYFVKNSDGLVRVKTKVRDVKWSKYLAERYTESKYLKAGYIIKNDFDDIPISLINDSFFMINEIMKTWNRNRFFYLPKRKLQYDKQEKGLQ